MFFVRSQICSIPAALGSPVPRVALANGPAQVFIPAVDLLIRHGFSLNKFAVFSHHSKVSIFWLSPALVFVVTAAARI
jgi:hypothetical protein